MHTLVMPVMRAGMKEEREEGRRRGVIINKSKSKVGIVGKQKIN